VRRVTAYVYMQVIPPSSALHVPLQHCSSSVQSFPDGWQQIDAPPSTTLQSRLQQSVAVVQAPSPLSV
jgi:hypothetical protein